MLIKVVLFICGYLMIGLGIQLIMRMVLDKYGPGSAEAAKQAMDVIDYAVFDDASQSNSLDYADEVINDKTVLIINVLVWPLNIAIAAYIYIKLKWPFRK